MNNKKTAQVYHFDLYGTRDSKYEFLHNNSLKSLKWNELNYSVPNYFFVKKDFTGSGLYEAGFKIDELFLSGNTGLNTEFDELAIQEDYKEAEKVLKILKENTGSEALKLLDFTLDKIDKINKASEDVKSNKAIITKIITKPFETKHCIYTGNSNGIMGRPRNEIMKHMLSSENFGLISMRQYAFDIPYYCYTFISKQIVTSRLFLSNKGYCSIFPLYLYPEKDSKTATRTPNLNSEIVQNIADGLGLKFTNEKESDSGTFAPIDILDYIYAVLHSPTYREKYKEFLKIDFPRVPYPKDKETFWKLVRLGGELRQIHLLESPAVEKYITKYPADGDNVVNKIKYQDGKVYINDTQHFANVPEVAWSFFIGGYQPAQKWLKDRKGRKLEFDDILHYQKIIVALTETDRIMKEVDEVEVE